MNKILTLITFLVFSILLTNCGPQAYVRGTYDQNVNEENLMNDRWSETDMQQAVKTLVNSAVSHSSIKNARKPPIVMVTRLQNKTSEHIDTQNIMDMLRVELTKTGSVQFVDKAARDDIKDEYDYQSSGIVSEASKKTAGGQIGADLIINGRLDSIVQQVGRDKSVYYKITLNMTNLKTGIIVWTDYKQIRKRYKKQPVGF
jgi:hypothetical protein